MKKIIIGITLLLSGLSTILFLLHSAIAYLPQLTAWSRAYPSRVFFLIFAGHSQFSDGADGLGLGVFFVGGVLLVLLGLAILGREYFRKEK